MDHMELIMPYPAFYPWRVTRAVKGTQHTFIQAGNTGSVLFEVQYINKGTHIPSPSCLPPIQCI
jgi:hypothetical protein